MALCMRVTNAQVAALRAFLLHDPGTAVQLTASATQVQLMAADLTSNCR